MKLFKRLHVLAAVGICSILYFGWILPTINVKARLQKVLSGSAVRIVIFGDNWSDIGSYRISPPSKDVMPARTSQQGQLWTEVLCEGLVCDYIDNFARPLLASIGLNETGAVVSNGIMANSTHQDAYSTKKVPDFKTQIEQWRSFEKQKRLMPSRHFKEERTIFTVLFGFWDLWHYSRLDKADAEAAVDATIMELFTQLDALVEASPSPPRIVLPYVVDITLLPSFAVRSRNSSYPSLPQDQHRATYLFQYWNTALAQVAADWKGARLFMPDLNNWVVGHLRANQLWNLGVKDASGAGQQAPMFDEVKTPCISPANSTASPAYEATSGGPASATCDQAEKHLFWDDLHLGGRAHLSFGRETVALVLANQTVNDWKETIPPSEPTSGNREARKTLFSLVLPPGS